MVYVGELGKAAPMIPLPRLAARLLSRISVALCLISTSRGADAPARNSAGDEGITWLVQFDGKALPDPAIWKALGAPKASIEEGAMHLVDDSQGFGAYRASWPAGADQEIIVDAKVQAGAVTG